MSCTCTSEPANPAEDNFLPVYTTDPKCPIHGHTSVPPQALAHSSYLEMPVADLGKFASNLDNSTAGAPAAQETAQQLYKRFGGLICSNRVIDDIYAAGAASLRAEVARLEKERDSWRRVAERLEDEKVAAEARIRELEGGK